MNLTKLQLTAIGCSCFVIGAGVGACFIVKSNYFFWYILRKVRRVWPFVLNSIRLTCSEKKRIKVIKSKEEFLDVIPELETDLNYIQILGFDCEWTSSARETSSVALLQLATFSGLCLLIRLSLFDRNFPVFLQDLLKNRNILKVGVGAIDDAQKLFQDYGFIVNGCMDLRFIAEKDQTTKLPSKSLKSLALYYLHITMNKSMAIRCSDWNSNILSKDQIQYAADDAFIGLQVFFKMLQKIFQFANGNDVAFETILVKGLGRVILQYCYEFIDVKYKNKAQSKNTLKNKREKQLDSMLKKQLKSYSGRKAVLYDNCKLQAPDGELLTTCDKKKAMWYINKELADLVSDEPLTVRLRFEPAGRSTSDEDSYYLIDKENVCVVCGSPGPIVRKNVVPQEYRKHFPLKMKDHSSHDVVPLCIPCHRNSGFHDHFLRRELAEAFHAPLGSVQAVQVLEDPERRSVRSAGRALLRAGINLPLKRKDELEAVLKSYFQVDHVTNKLIDEASTLETKFKNEAYVPHGQKVISSIFSVESIEGLMNFEKKWRKHFLDKMNPKHMPARWSVTHNHSKILKSFNK